MAKAATKKFSIKFDGDAIEDNSIEIKDLAPSLMALAELVDESFAELNGGKDKVSIKVQALKSGSFEVFLEAGTRDILNFFASENANALLNVLQTLGIVTGATSLPGLFALLKKSQGKKPEKVIEQKDGNINLVFDSANSNSILISKPTFNIYKSIPVREKAEQTVSVLSKSGIQSITFKDEKGSETEKITQEQKKYFTTPSIDDQEDEIISESEREVTVSLVNVALKEDNKWRLSSGGDKPFYAILKDEAFLEKINADAISFRKNDHLRVKLKTIQTNGPKGLNEQLEIVEVLEHIKAKPQLNLPIEKE